MPVGKHVFQWVKSQCVTIALGCINEWEGARCTAKRNNLRKQAQCPLSAEPENDTSFVAVPCGRPLWPSRRPSSGGIDSAAIWHIVSAKQNFSKCKFALIPPDRYLTRFRYNGPMEPVEATPTPCASFFPLFPPTPDAGVSLLFIYTGEMILYWKSQREGLSTNLLLDAHNLLWIWLFRNSWFSFITFNTSSFDHGLQPIVI